MGAARTLVKETISPLAEMGIIIGDKNKKKASGKLTVAPKENHAPATTKEVATNQAAPVAVPEKTFEEQLKSIQSITHFEQMFKISFDSMGRLVFGKAMDSGKQVEQVLAQYSILRGYGRCTR